VAGTDTHEALAERRVSVHERMVRVIGGRRARARGAGNQPRCRRRGRAQPCPCGDGNWGPGGRKGREQQWQRWRLFSLVVPAAGYALQSSSCEVDKRATTTALVCSCGSSSLPALPFRPPPLSRPFSSRSLLLLPVSLPFLPPSLPPFLSLSSAAAAAVCSVLFCCPSAPPAAAAEKRGERKEGGERERSRGTTETRVASAGVSWEGFPLCCRFGRRPQKTKRTKKGKPPTSQRTHHSTEGQETHTRGCGIGSSTQWCRRHGDAPLSHEAPHCPFTPHWFCPSVWPQSSARKRLTAQSKRRAGLRHNHTSSRQQNRTNKCNIILSIDCCCFF
jgi:hypothetical protein